MFNGIIFNKGKVTNIKIEYAVAGFKTLNEILKR